MTDTKHDGSSTIPGCRAAAAKQAEKSDMWAAKKAAEIAAIKAELAARFAAFEAA